MDNRERGLLADVTANHKADGPKLVYADWLEERGEAGLALAYRWAGRRHKAPMRCAPGVGWLWLGGPGGRCRKLPVPLFVPMGGAYDVMHFGTPGSVDYRGRKYYHTLPAAFGALARALHELRDIVEVPG